MKMKMALKLSLEVKFTREKNELHREKIASDFPTLCNSGVSLMKIQNGRNFYLLYIFDK
jgi:hypothetical protein